MFTYGQRPRSQAIAIIALMAMSTGITSAVNSSATSIERINPFPAATTTPTGPFRLSTQPGIGSSIAGVTETRIRMTDEFIILI